MVSGGESSRLALLALSRDVRPTRELLLLSLEPLGTSSRALREVRSSNSYFPCMIFICDCRFSTEFVRLWIISACSSRSGRECMSSRSLPTSESSDCWVFSNLSMRARVSLTRFDRGNRVLLTLLSSKRMRSASAPDSAAEVAPPPSIHTEPRETSRTSIRRFASLSNRFQLPEGASARFRSNSARGGLHVSFAFLSGYLDSLEILHSLRHLSGFCLVRD